MRSTLRRFLFGCAACALLAGPALAEETAGKALPSMCKQPPRFDENTLPPWQGGTNNDATDRGLPSPSPRSTFSPTFMAI